MNFSVFIYTIILWSWTTEVYGQQIVKRAANCPKITSFNGRVKYRRKGQRAVFKCPSSLKPYGPKRANCQPDGTWDVEPPICVDDGCTPLDISNVYKLDMDVQKGVVKFTCTDDYVLIGESMIYCDGKVWSASMPRCAAPHELTECDFEIDLCGWTNEDSDHTDWIRNTGITPTGDTGPKYDHTYMTEKSGYYMYFETSSPTGTDEYAVLKSPSYPPNLSPICFDFWYHIEGPNEPGHVGDLDVFVIDESQFIDDDDVKPMWEISGNQGADWKRGAVKIEQQDESFQIAFMATKRQSYISDIAIDDVRLYNCTDNSTIGVTTPKSSSTVPPTTTPVVTSSTSTPVPTTTNAPTTVVSETTESPTTTSATSTQAPTTESPSTPAPTTPFPSTAAPTTPVPTTLAPTTKAPTTTTKQTTKAATTTTTKSTTKTTTTSAPPPTTTVRTTTRKPTTPIPPPPPTTTQTTRTTTVSTTLAPTTSTPSPTTSTPSPTTEQPTVPTTQKLHTTSAPTRTTSRPTPRRTTQPTTRTSIPALTVPAVTQTAATTNKPSSTSARNPTTAKATKRSNSITTKTPTVGNTTKDNTISVAEGRSKHPDDETLKPLMIGLGVGIVAGVIIIGVVAYVCVRRKRFYTSRYEDELKPITSAGSVHSLNTDHFYKDEEYESESLK